MYFKTERSKIMCRHMKFNIFVLLILFLFSCNERKVIKNSIEQELPISIENKQEDHAPLHAKTSLILLPREEYSTYRDHYEYISKEEYFETNYSDICHLEDSISIGFSDNEGALGLADSLCLNIDWLCIRFPSLDQADQRPTIDKAKTLSYGAKDNVIDYVPLTLLSVQNDNELAYDIAFRGQYEISDFKLLERKNLLYKEQIDIAQMIQKEIIKETAIPPRPMTTDTLSLDNIFKVSHNTTVAKYLTTKFSYSDGDLGNEVIFVIQNGKLNQWFAGMSCRYNIFELRNEKYLYINVSTYATVKTTLLKLDKDDIKEVYTYLIIGD